MAGLGALGGAWNFRDVAETTGVLRPGRLFRSSELSALHDADRVTLRRLGISDIADLRSRREVDHNGAGRVPDGIAVHLLPIPDPAVDGAPAGGQAPHEHAFSRLLAEDADDASAAETAIGYMLDEYRRFPTLGGTRRALHRVASLLADGRPVLAHCFAGKDRTGFLVALVLEAAGVGREVIVADYLRSNAATAPLRARLLGIIEQRSETAFSAEQAALTRARLSDEVLGVREEYLVAARESVDEHFGSLGNYLRAAGITEPDVARLRAALLG
jgi:protein-tyrosine phosphatase